MFNKLSEVLQSATDVVSLLFEAEFEEKIDYN